MLDIKALYSSITKTCVCGTGLGQRQCLMITGTMALRHTEHKEKSWLEPERKVTEQETQRILAAAVVLAVLGAISNQSYHFHNRPGLRGMARALTLC